MCQHSKIFGRSRRMMSDFSETVVMIFALVDVFTFYVRTCIALFMNKTIIYMIYGYNIWYADSWYNVHDTIYVVHIYLHTDFGV